MILVLTVLAAAGAADFESARQWFERGIQHTKAGETDQAIESFKKSLAARDTAAAWYNLGVACQLAGRPPCAAEAVDRFLASSSRDQKAREAALAIQRQVAHQVARVTLEAGGGAEEIRVDGATHANRDGEWVLWLSPGDHAFSARRTGYAPQERTVTVEAGGNARVQLDATRDPLPGRLSIRVQPPDATIRVGTRTAGLGRVELDLPPGRHALSAQAPGFEGWRTEVQVAPGAEVRIEQRLNRSPTSLTERWWFWTGVVALAAAATATAIVVLPREGDVDPGSLGVLRGLGPRP